MDDPSEVGGVGLRLLGVATTEQRHQRERRVAQPAVPVVPVAHAAKVLRQGSRGGGDQRPGLLVRKRLQRDQGPQDFVPVFTVVRATIGPLAPGGFRARERRLGVLDRRWGMEGLVPRQHEALSRPLDGIEAAHHLSVLRRQLERRAEAKRVGTRGDHHASRRDLHRGNDRAVVGPQTQLHAHRHATPQALHDAHQLGGAIAAARHEVDQPHGALGGLEVRLEHQRPRPVAPGDALRLPCRRHQPAAVPLVAQQGREA